MKRNILMISLFIFIFPLMVNAETIEYNICKNGCEYSDFISVGRNIYETSNLSDKDIVIKITDSETYEWPEYEVDFGQSNNRIKSISIDGGNCNISYYNNPTISFFADEVNIKNVRFSDVVNFLMHDSKRVKITSSQIRGIAFEYLNDDGTFNDEEINISDVFEIDNSSYNHLKMLGFAGKIKIQDMDFTDQVVMPMGGTINIYNSNVKKVLNFPAYAKVDTNIYNTKIDGLKYTRVVSEDDEAYLDFMNFFDTYDPSVLKYDIYEANGDAFMLSPSNVSNTMVYYDSDVSSKPSNELNLTDYLDYYTDDKEINSFVETSSVASIKGTKLKALKPGNTKVQVTTDDGHIVYNINLTVEKETIPEKIDKMTIKVPITGSKLKLWVLIVGGILLGIVGTCLCMLIKRKK